MALPKAVEVAKQDGAARLILVRAVDPATLPGGFTAAQVAAINGAAEYLRNVAGRLQSLGVERVSRSVCYASPDPAIVEAVRTVRPDFIVMVRGGADRVILGPVAEFVRQRTRMPIVLVAVGRPRPQPLQRCA
jgi:nucleotide-binding universal stress UspA family protein